jgi:murein L,D-transpeptidase YafK
MLRTSFAVKVISLTILVISSLNLSAQASDNIELLISRSKHTLSVKQGDVTLNTFKVAFGSGGKKAKMKEGDHTTPKGAYLINKIRDSENFHLFMLLNYPNMEDAKRALKDNLITRTQYRSILLAQIEGRLPPQNTALGGSIGIHGIGIETDEKIEIHQYLDWTKGCIAMRNDEVDALRRYIAPGTKVIITD